MSETGVLAAFLALECFHWDISYRKDAFDADQWYCEDCKGYRKVTYHGHIHVMGISMPPPTA